MALRRGEEREGKLSADRGTVVEKMLFLLTLLNFLPLNSEQYFFFFLSLPLVNMNHLAKFGQ